MLQPRKAPPARYKSSSSEKRDSLLVRELELVIFVKVDGDSAVDRFNEEAPNI